MSGRENPVPPWQDLAEGISAVELSLAELKQRYQQVKRDQRQQEQLQELAKELKSQIRSNPEAEVIKAELEHLEKELVNLEMRLESRLWNWKELREPFWQIVRFTGIGIVIGWLLRACSS